MTVNQDTIFNELKLRIKLLDKQDEQMAGRMEEKLLLWLVSDTINQSDNIDELIYNFLERISVIRDISFSACCRVSDNTVSYLNSYSAHVEDATNDCFLTLSASLIHKLKSGPCFINFESFYSEGVYLKEDIPCNPKSVSIFPFQSLYIPFGIFVFVDEEKTSESLASISIVIKQIINMAIERLEKLTTLEELKELNISFEKKLRDRTKKLGDNNKLLKKEIKEIKEKEKGLIKAKTSFDETVEYQLPYLMNISHEIRTPLNGILGFTELIRNNDIVGQDKEKYINIIKSCGKSLIKIIDDVVSLSKIESNLIQIHKEDFPISKFMSELYDFFKNDELFKQRDNVELRLNLNFNGNTIINTDEKRLKQILENLIGNALKYTEEGHIEIGCKITEDENYNGGNKDILFFVKDTGIGIDPEFQEIIFDKFVKFEHDISRLFGGTGLGLTIAKDLTEKLGGKISFNSKSGTGSEFYFTLPASILVFNGNDKLLSKKELKEKYNWNGKRVLIVEDDEMSYIYLKEVLKSTKIDIIHAKDGKEAIEMAKANTNINIVLMDIKLPEMDGFEATKRIKEIREYLPIIAQTAYAMSDDYNKSLQIGCDDYISKPINRRKLLQSMDTLLK